MKRFGLCGVVAILFWPAISRAQSKVEGSCAIDGQPVQLKFAYAHLHDNAEKILERPRELRILLADRAVPAGSLEGLAFPPVWDMAMQGKVRGLLIELDPGDTQKANVVILEPAAREQHRTLATLTLSRTGAKLFKSWSFTGARVSGALDYSEKKAADPATVSAEFSVKFDAPVTKEPPVTAILTGKAAADSPQAAVLRKKVDLLIQGDLAGLRKIATRRAQARIDAMPPEVRNQIKTAGRQAGLEERKQLAHILRVVVRGDKASVWLSKTEWQIVLREGGQWKFDE